MKTFGERLRYLRVNKANKSQKEFGKLLGLSESAVGMYERNARKPDFETLEKIASYFEVTTDYLLTGKKESTNRQEEVHFSTDDLKVLEEIKKHPTLFHDLANAPEKKIKQLIKMWEFIKKDLEEDVEDDDIIED